MTTDDFARLNSLSEKAMNETASRNELKELKELKEFNEFNEFNELLEDWNECGEFNLINGLRN
ncbi:MAG: hypothetical protein HRT53_16525 [Colwellia sp.]|nr:hypothetical protein [Colwellia sp.]